MIAMPVPDEVVRDPRAQEVLRVWLRGGDQGFTCRHDVWGDPAMWGILLVDLARHIARGYSQTDGRTPADTLMRIREGFDAEWTHPTGGAAASGNA